MEDIVTEIVDQLYARSPKSTEQLEDMMAEELDKHPEVSDTETAEWVKVIIRDQFNF